MNIDKCPHCGCMIYDPFKGETKIHNVEKCIDVKLEQSAKNFSQTLIKNTKDIDPYYNEFVDDNFEDLT